MTTSILRRGRSAVGAALVVLALGCAARSAEAQTQPATDIDWQHGTTLFGFAGAQSASSQVNPAAGLGLGWEVTRRFAVEGRATWFRVNEDTPDFTATMAAHVPVTRGRVFQPFVAGGIGMYRATVDSGSSVVPEFYRNRMADGFVGRRTFQDFLVTFGGGVDMRLTNHFFVRPEANMMVVTTQADHRQVGVYGVELVYHFESHPIE
jgi:hypothetical protein